MDTNKESQIRNFVQNRLKDAPDLRVLTLGILKRQYITHVGCESLSPEAKTGFKRIVEEELLNMQTSGTDLSESEKVRVEPSIKRKRGADDEDESSAKKPRRGSGRAGERGQVEVSSETGSDAREDQARPPGREEGPSSAGEQADLSDGRPLLRAAAGAEPGRRPTPGGPQRKPRGQRRCSAASGATRSQTSSSEDEDEDRSRTPAVRLKVGRRRRNPSSGEHRTRASADEDPESTSPSHEGHPDHMESPGNTPEGQQKGGEKNGRARHQARASAAQGASHSSSDGESEEEERLKKVKEQPQSDEDGGKDMQPEEEVDPKQDGGHSDTHKEPEAPTARTEGPGQDSDCSSSSLTPLEEEEEVQGEGAPTKKTTPKKGDKTRTKGDDSNREKGENRAVLRLKRYIALCGVRRNYKKLLQNCRSVRSKVEVLKQDLEGLGVRGTPTLEKCKIARLKREEEQELAGLDVSNIITTQGRPKRRGAWTASPAARYQRAVNSDSDDGPLGATGGATGRHWANLQGVISDDADSD